jgi:pilus assembly protein CpaB
MNRRLFTVLIIAFLVAGVCALLVYRLIGSRISAAKATPTARVVAAATDLKVGTLISAANLTTTAIAGTAPKGSFTDPKEVIGRGVTADLFQGEAILDSRLAAKGSSGGLVVKIPDGMRALAVKVDDVVGVAGFVTPGMHVDVLVSGTPPGANSASQGELSATVLQNIEVLSAGTDIEQDQTGKAKPVQVVNLLVTPEQAQKLSLASNQLKIQLVLRNQVDTKVAEIPSTPTSALFPGAAPAPSGAARRPRAAAPEQYQIVVTNGATTTIQKLSGGQL